jgi:uncharacterized membrane protein
MSILHVSADAPEWVHVAATSILVLHIGGGGVGLVSGATALIARKGERLHRVAGNVFFVAMLTMSGIGASVAPFLSDRVSTIAGILTFYLVATAWVTVRRKEHSIGRFEIGAFFIALGVAGADLIFYKMAMDSPTGTLDGAPPQSFYVIGALAALAVLADLNLILRGGLSGAPRIARHLWRMCAALFVAAGSFFLGQPQVFPAFLHGSPILFVPVIAPLALMIFWLVAGPADELAQERCGIARVQYSVGRRTGGGARTAT